MNIPEGFTPRGDSNEQPPETYDKMVQVVREYGRRLGPRWRIEYTHANELAWKIPDGPMRIIAYKMLS